MLTIGQLAKALNLSRTTLLYYEKQGLLAASQRAENGYRYYDEAALLRLQRVASFRAMGLSVEDIRQLLNNNTARDHILAQHLQRLDTEIQSLRQQQQVIIGLLNYQREEQDMVTKEKWTEIMKAAGLSDEQMHNWHRQFERMEPDAHAEFLASIGCSNEEITHIRQWSAAD